MNHHHPSQQPTPTALCARIAPLLPALDEWGELSALSMADDTPSSDELVFAYAHVATCAYCQAQRDADARLDMALHNAVGLRAIAPLRVADIMAELLVAQPDTLPTPVEMGAETMATSVAAPVAQANTPEHALTPPAATSPITSQFERSRPASVAPHRRQAPAWLATVAAALVIALLAAGAVRSAGWRVGGGPTGTGRPTTTTSPYTGGLFHGEGPALTDITMVSPTEGWAFGPSQPGQLPLMYHLLDNVWTPVSLSSAVGTLDISTPTALSFYSPTDGLAFFSSFYASEKGHYISALHYDGRSWRLISRGALDDATASCIVSAFQMVSPTEGWGVCSNPTIDNRSLLHYVNQSWSTVALPAGLNTTLDSHHTIIPNTDIWLTDLSMQSATDGWAVGYVAGTGANPTQRSIGFILQYKDGRWSVSARYSAVELRSVSALASGDVWVAGDQVKYQGGAGANRYAPVGSTPTMLRYQRSRWKVAALPLPTIDPTFTSTGAFTQIVMRSPTDGWVVGNEVSQEYRKGSLQETTISPLLFHFDGVRWQSAWTALLPKVAQARLFIAIERVAFTANGDWWAVGEAAHNILTLTPAPLILRYHNGAWTIYVS